MEVRALTGHGVAEAINHRPLASGLRWTRAMDRPPPGLSGGPAEVITSCERCR